MSNETGYEIVRTNPRKRKHDRSEILHNNLAVKVFNGEGAGVGAAAAATAVSMVKIEAPDSHEHGINGKSSSPACCSSSAATSSSLSALNPENFRIPFAGLNNVLYQIQTPPVAPPAAAGSSSTAANSHSQSQTPDSTDPTNDAGCSEEDPGAQADPRLSTDGSPTPSDVFTVACGYCSGKLHMDKFYCPGIHQLCIEYEGQLISPKQFTIIAGKDKQKDWKAAIKMNQQPMRVLFEKQKIDFYKHGDFCSGRCVSKVVKPLVNSSQHDNDNSDTSTSLDPILANIYDQKPPNPISFETVAVVAAADSKEHIKVNKPLPIVKVPPPETPTVSTTSAGNGHHIDHHVSESTIFSDPDSFWTALYQLGIFFELTQEIDEQLNILRTCFKLPEMRSKAAHKLSELVKVLDLKDKIHVKLLSKRSLTKAQSVVVENELCELKKIAETHEKKQKEIKRKAEIFDQLINAATQNNQNVRS